MHDSQFRRRGVLARRDALKQEVPAIAGLRKVLLAGLQAMTSGRRKTNSMSKREQDGERNARPNEQQPPSLAET